MANVEETESIVKRAQAALSQLGLDVHRTPIRLTYAEGVLTMQGDLPDIRAKKRALEACAALPEVRWVEDRLRVEPSAPMGDGQILAHLETALLSEPVFQECMLRAQRGKALELVRDSIAARGTLEVSVNEGVVRFEGRVPSLSHKRLAAVLAWWIPGVRDVQNGLEVDPAEEDSDDEISDALRLVFDKDPLLDASEIGFSTERSIVTLRGVVASEEQRRAAEHDALYLFGVDDVVNEIEVRPEASARWRRMAS